MSNTETVTEQKGLVGIVMKFLKLDDAGIVDRFFSRETTKLKRKIKEQKQNLNVIKMKQETYLEVTADKVVDRKEELESAYTAITVEDIATNQLQDSFSKSYWANVENKQRALDMLDEEMEARTKLFDEEVAEYEATISVLENRMKKIKKG